MEKNKRIFWLILITTCIRLLPAALLELGNDEVYYYTYALHLQPNYFDHPPGVAFLIKLFSLNLLLQDELFIRLGAIICAAIGTYLCYRIGKLIRNERTGFFAAVLYNTSIYTSVIAGTFILPDSPQVVFWLAALLVMCRMCLDLRNGIRISLRHWLLFGFLAGCCMLCKVHGIFLWFGLGLFILVVNWKYLLHPGLYIGLFISAVIISPIIAWNINNHFVSWNYHSGRINTGAPLLNMKSFLRAFLGQIAYNNPVNVLIAFAAVLAYLRRKHQRDMINALMLCTSLPIILVTSGISLFNNVLPHWSGPGFLTLSFSGAIWLDQKVSVVGRQIPALLRYACVLIITVLASGLLAVKFFPGTMGKITPPEYGKGDFTLDMWGWRKFNHLFEAYRERQKLKGNVLPNTIVSTKWFPAAHLEYYISRPLNMELTGVGKLADLHHFVWLNKYQPNLRKGSDALAIVPSNYPENVMNGYYGYFKNVKLLNTFSVERGGEPARFFSLYLLEEYLQTDEAHSKKELIENVAYREAQPDSLHGSLIIR